ncbi:hypothetical protein K443DRAFT_101041, partial [Laccaria amethystina LaAM-08-1]
AAPGKVLITQDGWSANTTKPGFQGMTTHWIAVTEGKWKLKAAFKVLSGGHSGENLGRYFMGLLDHLYTATLDNMGNNNTTCKTIQDIHTHRGLEWNSDGQQLPYVFCLGHVVNLGNVDVMGHITKIAAVENATAIWEYDPT